MRSRPTDGSQRRRVVRLLEVAPVSCEQKLEILDRRPDEALHATRLTLQNVRSLDKRRGARECAVSIKNVRTKFQSTRRKSVCVSLIGILQRNVSPRHV